MQHLQKNDRNLGAATELMQHLKLIAKLPGKLHFYDCEIENWTHTHTQEPANVPNYISEPVWPQLSVWLERGTPPPHESDRWQN